MQGLRDKINEKLAEHCETYNVPLLEANFRALQNMELSSLIVADLWLTPQTWAGHTLKLAPEVTSADMREILDILDGLTDYGVIDDSYLAEVEHERYYALVKQIADDEGVDVDMLMDEFIDADCLDYEFNSDVYIRADEDTYQEVLGKVKERMSTWEKHYYPDLSHFPDYCWYCKRAEQEQSA